MLVNARWQVCVRAYVSSARQHTHGHTPGQGGWCWVANERSSAAETLILLFCATSSTLSSHLAIHHVSPASAALHTPHSSPPAAPNNPPPHLLSDKVLQVLTSTLLALSKGAASLSIPLAHRNIIAGK